MGVIVRLTTRIREGVETLVRGSVCRREFEIGFFWVLGEWRVSLKRVCASLTSSEKCGFVFELIQMYEYDFTSVGNL